MKKRKILLTLALLLVAFGVGAVSLYFPKVSNSQNKANEAFYNGSRLYNRYSYAAAAEFFKKALTYNPEFHIARRMLGQTLYFSGNVDEALNEWKIILDQKKYDPSLRLHLQNLGSQTQDHELDIVFDKIIPYAMGYRYAYPTFVGNNSNHNVFFLSMGSLNNGNLLEIDSNENYVRNLRRISEKVGVPIGAAIGNGELWVTDLKKDIVHRLLLNEKRILKLTASKAALGKAGSKPLEFHGPAGICFTNDFFYIADSGNNRIQKISSNGEFAQEFSGSGSIDLRKPFGLACEEKNIYVSEPSESRISLFDEYGNFQKSIGEEYLQRPRHIAFFKNQLLVADEAKGLFLINRQTLEYNLIEGYLNSDRNFIKFNRPYSASVDFYGNLLVANHGDSELIRFKPKNQIFENLDVMIERVDSQRFPVIGVWVTVKDSKSQLLTDLKSSNFRIIENDADVGNLSTSYLGQFSNQKTLIVLSSRSSYMKEFNDSIEWAGNFFISDLREKDKIKVISYSDKMRQESPFSNSKLRLQRALLAKGPGDYTKPLVSALGRALYSSITELIPSKGKRAIIVLTAGELMQTIETDFNLAKVKNYAVNNHIPLFIVSFENPKISQHREKKARLKQLAESTGGKYFSSFRSNLAQISQEINNKIESRYVLSYRSASNSDWAKQFLDLRVMVRFQNRTGIEIGGYFIPEKQ